MNTYSTPTYFTPGGTYSYPTPSGSYSYPTPATPTYNTPPYGTPSTGIVKVVHAAYVTPVVPSPSSVSGPVSEGTVAYRIAETPTALDVATYTNYTQHPTVLTYTFNGLGQKFIWVDFKGSNGTVERKSAQIEIVAPCTSCPITPTPTTSSTPTPTSIPKADLTIRSLRTVGVARVGKNIPINVDIRNSARTVIESISGITVEAVINTPSGSKLGTCSKAVTSIPKSGTTVQLTNCPNFTVKGKHTLTATVDSTNVVSESNENNNTLNTSVNVAK